MKKIIVKDLVSPVRIENYLHKRFPDFSRALIFKLLRLKKIKVNKVRCKIATTIQNDDVIEIYHDLIFSFKQNKNGKKAMPFLQTKGQLNVVYEDQNIVVIDKPVNLICQPGNDESVQTLQNLFLKHLYIKNELDWNDTFTPSICHRLDQNTAGLIIAAKNALALQEMYELLHNRMLTKLYECLIYGLIEPKAKTLKAYLTKRSDLNLVSISNKKTLDSKEIITKYQVIQHFVKAKMSLLLVELTTGRTHQIRAHFNFLGHPLVGETKYSQAQFHQANAQFKFQALHAKTIIFPHLDREKFKQLHYLSNMKFESQMIPWFQKLSFLK